MEPVSVGVKGQHLSFDITDVASSGEDGPDGSSPGEQQQQQQVLTPFLFRVVHFLCAFIVKWSSAPSA